MPKIRIDGQAYIQRRIIFVDNCNECPYMAGDALVPKCCGINKSQNRYGNGRELPSFFPKVPDWCHLDGADIC